MRPFTYERATTAEGAAKAAALTPGARFIAGGTNLLDLMKLEIETPQHLIDVSRLPMAAIEPTPEGEMVSILASRATSATAMSDEWVAMQAGLAPKIAALRLRPSSAAQPEPGRRFVQGLVVS